VRLRFCKLALYQLNQSFRTLLMVTMRRGDRAALPHSPLLHLNNNRKSRRRAIEHVADRPDT
jgi:hypothetical protein